MPLLFLVVGVMGLTFFASPATQGAVRGWVGGEQAKTDQTIDTSKFLASFLHFKNRTADEGPVITDPPVNPYNKRGVYLAASSVANPVFYDQTIKNLLDSGGSSFVFDVKGPFVYFESDAAIAKELKLSLPLYDLPAVIKKAHDKGLYTIARFIALKDPLFSQRVPEVQIRNPKTGHSLGDVWVDGIAPITLEFNRQILKSLLQSDVDEVNFDYIRYPSEYAQSSINLTGDEKADHVEAFLKMAKETRDEVNPHTKLGISTYAILGWSFKINKEAIGQDFIRFAPLVDVISPMAYPQTFSENAYYYPGRDPGSRDYYLVYRTLTGYRDLLPPEHRNKIRPWIQGYYTTVQDMKDQMQAVYDAGYCGFQVWNANNHYDVTYPAIKAMKVPAECQ